MKSLPIYLFTLFLPTAIHSTVLAKFSHDDDYLLKLVLEGSEWVQDRYYQNLMTGFSHLSDEDLSTVLNYVKMRFGNVPPTITPEDVATMWVQ